MDNRPMARDWCLYHQKPRFECQHLHDPINPEVEVKFTDYKTEPKTFDPNTLPRHDNNPIRSEQEHVIHLLATAWNTFLNIPEEDKHADDNNDFRKAIHDAQRIIYTQLYKKQNP